jgi:hypothetical protein
VWKEITLSKLASWFDYSNAPLLSGYVKSIAYHEFLASQYDAIEAPLAEGERGFKTLNRIHAMIERQARLIQTFATKLRLTQQSRYTAATASVIAGRHQGPGRGMRVNNAADSTRNPTIDLNRGAATIAIVLPSWKNHLLLP